MAALDDLQGQLADLRSARRAAERSHLEARETAARDPSEELAGKAVQARDDQRALLAEESKLVASLTDLGDPADLVESLSDDVPFVLFPVRLETRWKGDELLLRIYPDDCQVETFTELMSDSELGGVQQFWAGYWKAGPFEDQRRAAWRALVTGHGSGRSAWLVDHYRPAAAPPTKAAAEDVLLVVLPEVDPTPTERDRAVKYWKAVWRAGRNAMARDAARQAFIADVGAARAGELEQGWRPVNLADDPPPPHTRADVAVDVVTLELPTPGVTTRTSWVRAPSVTTLPDRFVAIGFRDGARVFTKPGKPIPGVLSVGPDPSLPKADQIQQQNGELVVDEGLKWLVDFKAATDQGMGMKIKVTGGGLDRLLVLGLRISADAGAAAADLERLLGDHKSGKNGLSVLPQGTPTNNTDGIDAGYSWLDDADGSYDRVFGAAADYPASNDPLEKRDGQYLAEALGIDRDLLHGVPHADGHDQAEARAMSTALWPATWGYFLADMLDLDAPVVEAAREHFVAYASGRGAVPPLRIGRQPYGILPATVWSRLRFGGRDVEGSRAFVPRLQALLKTLDSHWRSAAVQASWVGKPGDPHRTLLDIVALNPASVEYHQRYARGLRELFVSLRHWLGDAIADALVDAVRQWRITTLAQLGLQDAAELPILAKVFSAPATLLNGPVVDDVPLSEVTPIRAYAADGRNYIAWLAGATLDQIRREDFGPGHRAPRALLYIMLRHAAMLAYWDAAVRLLTDTPGVELLPALRETEFVHVERADVSPSRFEPLYRIEPLATDDESIPLAEYLERDTVLHVAPQAALLAELKRALDVLAGTPTARLERLFAEHVDLCSHRLDAWKLSLVHRRLAEQRERRPAGLYLGAYGWLDDVRPEGGRLTSVDDLPPDLAAVFTGDSPLMRDSLNAGHMHAPSVDQAAAAAILRNGYITRASEAEAETLTVNLSSERIRAALEILHGLRRGQPLAALLGYQFERGLHDRHPLDVGAADRFILPLRRCFPLVAGKLKSTRTPDNTPLEKIDANNVVDGLALVEHIRAVDDLHYPFELPIGTAPGQVPEPSGPEAEAIDKEVQRMLDAHDALGDVMVAESVYQVVRGQPERAGAAADVVGQGHFPPEPEIVRTPRSGLTLVHRVALQVDASATAPPGATPRAAAEPALAAWVASRLPAPDDVACAVSYVDVPTGTEKPVTVTQADLGLSPLDLVHVIANDPRQAATELDDRIEQHVRTAVTQHPGAPLRIRYTDPVPGKVTLFELGPLVRDLHALLLRSRALGAQDLMLPTAQIPIPAPHTEHLAQRIDDAVTALGLHAAPLTAAGADTTTATDAYLGQAAALLLGVALHGVPQTGTTGFRARAGALYDSVAGKLRVVVERWEAHGSEYQTILAGLPALPDDSARQQALQRAERLISTTETFPLPAPGAYATLLTPKKTAFDAALAALRAPLTASVTTLDAFFTHVESALGAMPAHDRATFDLEREKNDLVRERDAFAALREEVRRRVEAVAKDVDKRVEDATDLVNQARASTDAHEQLRLLEEAARKALGDDARVLPHFTLLGEQAADVAAAHGDSAALVAHLVAAGRQFPVDDWLYGAARAREKLAHWESATVLAEAHGADVADLRPLQLPYRAGDHWTALELADGYELDGEKLLYTTCFPTTFDATAPQCGVLVDEWVEIVPADAEVTGLAFHFDQPNSEPPQALLVVSPPAFTGSWHWDDLVDALGETLDSARVRLVEPQHLDAGPLGQFLPATMMAVTLSLITIAADLKDNLHTAVTT